LQQTAAREIARAGLERAGPCARHCAGRGARANDTCATVGAARTCSGNQSTGIPLNPNNAITDLFLLDLTAPIAPAPGIAGIDFEAQGTDGVPGLPGADLTVTTDATVSITTTNGGVGISVSSKGGNGADGSFFVSLGGAGGAGGAVTISNAGAITTNGSNAIGLSASSMGGGAGSLAGAGGGVGGALIVSNSGVITTTGLNAYGILANSVGGNGYLFSQDDGGPGARSGNVGVTNSGSIITHFDGSAAIYVTSTAGTTENSSAPGPDGGAITISNTGTIQTAGSTSDSGGSPSPLSFAHGILAVGLGGNGSDGEGDSGRHQRQRRQWRRWRNWWRHHSYINRKRFCWGRRQLWHLCAEPRRHGRWRRLGFSGGCRRR